MPYHKVMYFIISQLYYRYALLTALKYYLELISYM
jgi:hypothetical protein